MNYQRKFYVLLLISILAVCSFSFVLYRAQRLIFLTDISTQPLDPIATPDLNTLDYFHRKPVYLVSYADGPEVYFRNQYGLAESALGKGVDMILNYRRSHLDPEFVEKNKYILNKKTGAGYWLWKPWVILDAMKKAPENAVIIYSDTGSTFKGSLASLIKLTEKYSVILSYYEDRSTCGSASSSTKREVFVRLECDTPKCHNGPPIWAGFLIFKNTPEARNFVESWLQYAQDPSLLIEGPTANPELPEFKSHFHDQAILNVLYSRNPKGKYLIPYDEVLRKEILVWKHRKAGTSLSRPDIIYDSLIPYCGYLEMSKIDKFFYHNPFLRWLRKRIFESTSNSCMGCRN